ncbi:MAG: hypothetical protein HY465_03835 [Deltaproteobacteria bacterium]|nr:hypothetical protein [Deltaproteobacteria bacterium]
MIWKSSWFVFLFFPVFVYASEPTVVSLAVPPGLSQQLCTSGPLWKEVTVVWMGVKDNRPSPAIGEQQQRNKDPVTIVAATPLERTFDSALRDLFTTCGMTFVPHGDETILRLEVEIRQFDVTGEKKLVSGKGTARSELVFEARREETSATTIVVTAELYAKGIRNRGVKQVGKLANQLLEEILREVAATHELQNLK